MGKEKRQEVGLWRLRSW